MSNLVRIIVTFFVVIIFISCSLSIPEETIYSLHGVIQKGPFIAGTNVTVQQLNAQLGPTGVSYDTVTTDDFGHIELGAVISSKYIEVITSGYYYDEVSGSLSPSIITLRAIADLSESETVNVNILTTISRQRIQNLFNNEGYTVTEAIERAKNEVLAAFGINIENIVDFSDMDISGTSISDSILLAVSTMIQWGHTVAEVSEFIAHVGTDIADNGIIDNSELIDFFMGSFDFIDVDTVLANLQNRCNQLGLEISIPSFQFVLDAIDTQQLPIAPYITSTYPGIAGHRIDIQLYWEDKSNDESGFIIECSTDNGSSFQQLSSVAANVTEFYHFNVSQNSDYMYRIYAIRQNQESPYSNTISVQTPFLINPGGSSELRGYSVNDFNNDGIEDIAIGSLNTVYILYGNGDGTFINGPSYTTSINIISVRTADVDNDSDYDIIVFTDEVYNEGKIYIFLNSGDGTFPTTTNKTIASGIIAQDNGMILAKINNDNYIDVITYSEAAAGGMGSYTDICRFSVLYGNGDGTLQDAINYDAFEGITSIVANDIDGDGDADIVTSSCKQGFYGVNRIGIFINDGSGNLVLSTQYEHPYEGLYDVYLEDTNTDNNLDIISASSGGAGIYLGNGDGTFATPSFFNTIYNPHNVLVADYNQDLKVDYFFGNFGINYHNGIDDGTIPLGTIIASGYVDNMSICDINNDGKIDIVWGCCVNNSNVVIRLGL